MNDFSKRSVRLIGIGNDWRGDDGAGRVLAEKVRGERIPGLEVILHSRDGASLIPLWEGIDRVILVDAVCDPGASGRLLRFDLRTDPLSESLFPVSTHALGILEAIRIMKAIHRPLPAHFLLFGVTGKRFEAGTQFSFDPASLADTFLNRIKEEMRGWNCSGREEPCTNRR